MHICYSGIRTSGRLTAGSISLGQAPSAGKQSRSRAFRPACSSMRTLNISMRWQFHRKRFQRRRRHRLRLQPLRRPSPGSTPTYCQGISAAQSPGQKVMLTDNSGTGGIPVLYVATGTQYLNAQGQMTNWSTCVTAQPFPLTCFPGSTGGSGATFELPVASAGRMFIALATPPPSGSTTPPNPLILMGNNGGGYAPPDNKPADSIPTERRRPTRRRRGTLLSSPYRAA